MAKTINTSAATADTDGAGTAVTFADKAFKSRTLVLEDGRAFAVDKSRIVATDLALIAHLDQHPEFDRVVEA